MWLFKIEFPWEPIFGARAVTRRRWIKQTRPVGYGAITAKTSIKALVAPNPPYEPCTNQWLLRGMNFWATR
jgi:hypothetical protein